MEGNFECVKTVEVAGIRLEKKRFYHFYRQIQNPFLSADKENACTYITIETLEGVLLGHFEYCFIQELVDNGILVEDKKENLQIINY